METTRERQAYGLRLPKPSHPQLRLLRSRHAPSAQGHKTWNATWLLADFLTGHPLPQGLRVLDTGCGWGLAPAPLGQRSLPSISRPRSSPIWRCMPNSTM